MTGSSAPVEPPLARARAAPTARPIWQRALPWLITIACFAWLYAKVNGAAAREGVSLAVHLAGVFGRVDWLRWLGLMIPYSLFFFLIDTLVVWRVISWFNTPVRYLDILPIRGSSYILSIVNEQVSKGAMALYLNRRDGVPGWEVGSSMLFIMVCEFYYLLTWATVGWLVGRQGLPPLFSLIPWVAGIAVLAFVGLVLFFRGSLPFGAGLRTRAIFKAFREASPIHYVIVILLRSPALLAAVLVYTLALRLFGIEVGYIGMLGILPVIFFGAATPGPMRTVAVTLWVALFPGYEGAMTAFGFVQHNFFIFFNAAIGLVFMRRANRELFGRSAD